MRAKFVCALAEIGRDLEFSNPATVVVLARAYPCEQWTGDCPDARGPKVGTMDSGDRRLLSKQRERRAAF